MDNEFTPLSTGAIAKIIRGEDVANPLVVQILSSGRIKASNDGKDRYRCVISDGIMTHSFAMLATELNTMYEANELSENTIVRVDRHTCSIVNRTDNNERRIVILFELAVLDPGEIVGRKIGNPVPSESKKSEPSTASSGYVQKENMNGNSSAQARNPYQKSRNDYNANQSMNASSANLSEHLTMPIDGLSPYQNKWVIKARVMSKSNIRTWNNQKGEGKLFSFDLCDETGEIRATAFNQQVDKYFEILEVDKVYYITKCTLKPANKQYSKLKNDYEMTLGNDSEIQECTDITQIPAIKYNFVKIDLIANMEAGAFVDVIAVVKETSDPVNLTSKAGKDLVKREITLVDESNAAISLTMWGDDAKNFNGLDQPVIIVKGAKIGEYGGGKTLGMAGGTAIKMNPDVPEGHKLRGWFDNGGVNADVKQLSSRGVGNYGPTEWLNFHEAKLKNMGSGDKPDYYQVKGFIHNIRSTNAFYKACPNENCNKKVVDNDNGNYRCDKCNSDSSTFKYRLLVNMLIGDWTSNRWVTAFSEVAEAMLGKTANEIGELLENNKDEAENIFNEISFQQKVFKVRTKIETYQDVPKNKISVLSVSDPNYKEYNKSLIANIQRLNGMGQAQK